MWCVIFHIAYLTARCWWIKSHFYQHFVPNGTFFITFWCGCPKKMIEIPTLVSPSGKSSIFIAVFSINATNAGVAKTGRVPEPSFSAVWSSVTVISCVVSFFVAVIFFCFYSKDSWIGIFSANIAVFLQMIIQTRLFRQKEKFRLLFQLFLLPLWLKIEIEYETTTTANWHTKQWLKCGRSADNNVKSKI